MKPGGRDGFSLLEVLMATSILLGSVIVLNQLAGIGRKNALAAQDLSTAQMLCESRLNEILAGTTAVEEVEEEPLSNAPGWVFSLSLEPVDRANGSDEPKLLGLHLSVSRAELERQNASRFTLVRWIADSRAEDRPKGLTKSTTERAGASVSGGL